MPTIVATAASATANSYLTDAEADTYADERLRSTNWTSESDDDVKARALIQATRWLDNMDFVGERTTEAQALEWPRLEAYTKDGYEYATDAVPDVVKRATFELALRLLNDNAASTDTLAESGLERFDEAKVGPLDVKIRHAKKSGDLPDPVRQMLLHVLRASSVSVTLERA